MRKFTKKKTNSSKSESVCTFPLNFLCFQSLFSLSFQIGPNWEDDNGVVFAATVNGVHCEIDELHPFLTSFLSHEEGGNACLDCKFAECAHKGKLTWIVGPFPTGEVDKDTFCGGLKTAVEKKQLDCLNDFQNVADDGHIAANQSNVLAHCNEFDPAEIA